jgi:hypothetical protein
VLRLRPRTATDTKQCGSRPPFRAHGWAASITTECHCRGTAHGSASIEGQGAPGRTPVYVAVSGSEVTSRQGRGIMVVKEERALIGAVSGFGIRTKHALGEVLAASLTRRSNYRLERRAGRGFDRPGGGIDDFHQVATWARSGRARRSTL